MSETTLNRVDDIARQIRASLSPMVMADGEHRDAKALATAARDGADGTREDVMLAVAELSCAQSWTLHEIDKAGAAVVNTPQADKLAAKSIANFIGQVKLAAHPKVRQYVRETHDLIVHAFEREKADKDSPRPLKRAFGRKLHTFKAALERLKVGEPVFTTIEALTDWAIACDPAHDYAKVGARLEAIRKQLSAFASDFPVDGLDEADRLLGEITADHLKAARDNKVRQAEAAAEAQRQTYKLAPVPGQHLGSTEDLPTSGPAPVAGVFDASVDVEQEAIDAYADFARAA